VSLATGIGTVGGAALTLNNPANLHNLIGGDGNDTLVAGPADTLLHGVELTTALPRGPEEPVKLLYLDSLEVAQLDANDFIFATEHLPLESGQPEPASSQSLRSAVVMLDQAETGESPGAGDSAFGDSVAQFDGEAGRRALKDRLWMEPVRDLSLSRHSVERRIAEWQTRQPHEAGPFDPTGSEDYRLADNVAEFGHAAIRMTLPDQLWFEQRVMDERRDVLVSERSVQERQAEARTESAQLDQLVQAMAAFAPMPPR